MTVNEVMAELEANGSDSIKRIWLKHGIKEPFFGVKIEYLKQILKKVKTDYELAKGLYATGNADAMYLAGLMTDDNKMTKADLQTWVESSYSNNINEYTVPWVTAGSRFGYELALEWIDSKENHIAAAGWSTLGNLVALKPDAELDLVAIKKLLGRVEASIHSSPNRVKMTMNNFVSCVGVYVALLSEDAIQTAENVGALTVDMNGTACKIPSAVNNIAAAKSKGTLGKKKKTVKC